MKKPPSTSASGPSQTIQLKPCFGRLEQHPLAVALHEVVDDLLVRLPLGDELAHGVQLGARHGGGAVGDGDALAHGAAQRLAELLDAGLLDRVASGSRAGLLGSVLAGHESGGEGQGRAGRKSFGHPGRGLPSAKAQCCTAKPAPVAPIFPAGPWLHGRSAAHVLVLGGRVDHVREGSHPPWGRPGPRSPPSGGGHRVAVGVGVGGQQVIPADRLHGGDEAHGQQPRRGTGWGRPAGPCSPAPKARAITVMPAGTKRSHTGRSTSGLSISSTRMASSPTSTVEPKGMCIPVSLSTAAPL